MRTITTETIVFKFDELAESAKKRAIDDLRDINVDHDWWDCVYEDFKQVCTILGIELSDRYGRNQKGERIVTGKCIYFSGFYSQGDGAYYEGTYRYAKHCLKRIKEYAPQDESLHSIASQLQSVQKRYFYGITTTISHRGNYSHSHTMRFEHNCYSPSGDFVELSRSSEEDVEQALRELADWLYQRLRQANEYLTSDEAIVETIDANDYEFDVDGKLTS